MANRHYIDVEPFKEQGLLKKRNAWTTEPTWVWKRVLAFPLLTWLEPASKLSGRNSRWRTARTLVGIWMILKSCVASKHHKCRWLDLPPAAKIRPSLHFKSRTENSEGPRAVSCLGSSTPQSFLWANYHHVTTGASGHIQLPNAGDLAMLPRIRRLHVASGPFRVAQAYWRVRTFTCCLEVSA